MMSSPRIHNELNEDNSEIYFKFFSGIEKPSESGQLWMLSERSHQLKELFNTLHIDTQPEDWRYTIDSHQVIMNRMPSHDKLIIGCGNLPEYSEKTGDVYFIDNYGGDKFQYRAKHSHNDADTIDPDFARNPTFVAEFGKTPIHELFKEHKYKEIIIEGIRILPWDLQSVGYNADLYTIDSLIALLDENGKVIDGDEVYNKAFLEEYRDNHCEQSSAYIGCYDSVNEYEPDPLLTWKPSSTLKNKAVVILDNEVCDKLEGFLSKYNLTLQDIDLTQAQLKEVLETHLWGNFEDYYLRPALTKELSIVSQKTQMQSERETNTTCSPLVTNSIFYKQSIEETVRSIIINQLTPFQ